MMNERGQAHDGRRTIPWSIALLVVIGCGGTARPRMGADADDREVLRMTVQLAGDGREALRVENVSDVALVLSRGVAIEALEVSGAAHERHELAEYGIEADFFFLVSSCDQPTRGCVTLDPGEIVLTVSWSGYYAAPQCFRETPSDYPAPAGRYRFVVTACSGGEQFFSPAFDHRAPDLK